MKALLLYPLFPQSFWSYDRFVEIAGLKAVMPPLGIITVASLLPKDWQIRFCDRNVEPETEADWDWCDIVILSSMIVQKTDFHALIRKAVELGKKVAVGGPYPTSQPQHALDSGANYLVLDEGELTIPLFIEALAAGKPDGVFRAAEKPDVSLSPMPRFDLLRLDSYLMMALQFSRGCPFNCEFCDIIQLYGRKPRTKEPEQMLAEMQAVYEANWRGPLFIVDDNFIGNQRNVKRFLRALIPWMQERNFPFDLMTEASVNLAEDDELLDLMSQAGFSRVFLGIETPDQDSLNVTLKVQNTRHPLIEACNKINEAGLVIYAGFILGFDGERSGAGQRIVDFVEKTDIPQPMLGILQAPPNTALWERLKKEERLINDNNRTGDQNSLMNFIPTRPITEIGKEYLESFWALYEPENYLRRCFLQCLKVGLRPNQKQPRSFAAVQRRLQAAREVFQGFPLGNGKALRLFGQILWLQGVRRPEIRWQFWRQLLTIMVKKPELLQQYIGLCAAGEHFWEYRAMARDRITDQLSQQTAAETQSTRPVAQTPALVG